MLLTMLCECCLENPSEVRFKGKYYCRGCLCNHDEKLRAEDFLRQESSAYAAEREALSSKDKLTLYNMVKLMRTKKYLDAHPWLQEKSWRS